MTEEVHELSEHAEHAAHESGLAPVTITMAILAMLIAAVSLMGHRMDTEQLLLQTKATDQWAYYQAKDIRRRSYELFLDQLNVFTVQNPAQIDKVKAKYEDQIKHYEEQQKDTEAEATQTEREVALLQKRGDRFDLSEVILEASLVICSITLLTHKRIFWGIGLALAAAGVVLATSGFLVH